MYGYILLPPDTRPAKQDSWSQRLEGLEEGEEVPTLPHNLIDYMLTIPITLYIMRRLFPLPDGLCASHSRYLINSCSDLGLTLALSGFTID